MVALDKQVSGDAFLRSVGGNLFAGLSGIVRRSVRRAGFLGSAGRNGACASLDILVHGLGRFELLCQLWRAVHGDDL
jgi:hypothetical protein